MASSLGRRKYPNEDLGWVKGGGATLCKLDFSFIPDMNRKQSPTLTIACPFRGGTELQPSVPLLTCRPHSSLKSRVRVPMSVCSLCPKFPLPGLGENSIMTSALAFGISAWCRVSNREVLSKWRASDSLPRMVAVIFRASDRKLSKR